ncbi:MAG TPA: plasmid replication protein RepH [Halococcus sp.]|nr:plasmid replication protein RepH [Halococcus sp.]
MSHHPVATDSTATGQRSDAQAGISLVLPSKSTQRTLTTPTVHDIGPRFTEWLPDILDALLPAITQTARELAFQYDPRTINHNRPYRFAAALFDTHGVGTGPGATTPAHPFNDALTKYALSYFDVDPAELSDRKRELYEYARDEIITVGTRDLPGAPTGLAALRETVVPLLAAGDSIPTIVLSLDGPAWEAIDDERTAARALDALVALGEVVDIRLVCSPRLDAHLERTHPDWYDEHLTNAGDTHRDPAPDEASESALTEAWETVGTFTPGGGRLRLLAALDPTGEREVRDLKADSEIDLSTGAIDRYVRELADEHGLVAIDDRHKFNRVALTDAGQAAQTLIEPDYRTMHPEQARLDSGLTRTRHGATSIVCRADAKDSPTPPAGSGGGGAAAAADGPPTTVSAGSAPASSGSASVSSASSSRSSSVAPERSLPLSAPSAEEWLADTGDAATEGYVQWLDGPDGRLDAWAMHERLLAGRRVKGVTFVDDPVEAFNDGQVTYISCFEDHAQVVAQWGGPLPTLVRITNALLSEQMFSKVLTPSAVGEDLDQLYDGALNDAIQDVLRLGAQIGWFSEDEREYDGLRDRYGAVRRLLLSKLGALGAHETAGEWSECCRDAHGLLASATHLYRAIGVDVTIHIRVPDTAKLRAGAERYRGFCDFFKHTVPKNAAYGVHSVYRMLYESRVDKLKHRMGYEFNDDDAPTAELTASWVVSGPTATTFREDVEQAIAANADEVRENIQEGVERGVALQIPVVEGNSYAALRQVVERHAQRKGFKETDEHDQDLRRIVRLSIATLGSDSDPGRCSPYALAEALLAIATARSPTATLTVSDVAHGLAQLPADRLLPSLPPTMQRALKVLLVADEPLGRSAIVDRAGISTHSYDRNIDELAALGFVESVGNGGHRTWNAWLIPWWSPLAAVDRPRTADNTSSSPAPPSRWDDVLYQIVLDLDLDHDYNLFAGPVDSEAVFDALPMLDRWRGVFEMHYGLGLERRTIRDADTDGKAAGTPVVRKQFVDIGSPPAQRNRG